MTEQHGTVRLGHWPNLDRLRRASARWPADLLVNINGRCSLARGGRAVVVPAKVARILAALFCGRVLSKADLIELLYGEDPDGGPDRAELQISQLIGMARIAGGALGFVINVEWGRGYSARLVVPDLNS